VAEQVPAGSPLWWLKRLEEKLHARQAEMQRLDRYYSGEHDLPFLTRTHNAKLHDEFRLLLNDSRSNFMRLVVDAVEERLVVEGFRLSAETDTATDAKSWDIWQANHLDADSQSAFADALIKGCSYLSVWAGERPDDYPVIAVEDPTQTIVAYVPGSNFRRRAAALKVWSNDQAGERRANVYLPDGIYKYRAAEGTYSEASSEATWEELPPGAEFVANPLGIVPIIPLRNRPRVLCEGESEICDLIPIQNSINGLLFLLALAGYFGAHRQRWAIGLKIMEDRNGNPIEPFDVAIDRLWQAENPETKFGEFSQTALDGYIAAIEQKVLHIAVASRTPRHYLIQDGQSPSGDALRSAESGLVKKVERKQRPFGEGLEEAIRLARRFAGEQDAPVDSEIVWADPQTLTMAEITDAVIKQYQAGLIPTDKALEQLGYTQTEIRRLMAQRAQEALFADLTPEAPEQVAA
jgi:hypothetical protein